MNLKEPDFPAVTIITVNFNGSRFLPHLFNSIKDLNYPHDKIQTVMVDNGSTDGSCELVSQQFEWVNIIKTGKNLGYSGGNNAAMKAAGSEYLALINNDCIVGKDWLTEMVKAAQRFGKDQKAGSISSKVLFFFSYLPFEFMLDRCGAVMSNLEIKTLPEQKNEASHFFSDNDIIRSVKLLTGCSSFTSEGDCRSWSWLLKQHATVGFPVPDISKNIEISFDIKPVLCDTGLKIVLSQMAGKKNDSGDDSAMVREVFSSIIKKEGSHIRIVAGEKEYGFAGDIINSCGLEVSRSFYARDRGSSSFDTGQFEKAEEVFCPSGSSLLLKKEMLQNTGYFDSDFFTYYEDIDLFWRARLEGWKSYFTPLSVARHHHCGTGTEWSYSFTYHVLRNRIIAIFKNGWPELVLRSYFVFVFSAASNIIFYILAFLKGKRQKRPDVLARFVIFFELFYFFTKKLLSRIKIRNNMKIRDSEIRKLLADF